MGKKYDVVATIGTYMAGNEKKYISRNVGSVIETQHGLSITLDACFNPAGCQITEDGKIWLKLFEPREKDAAQQAYNQAVAPQRTAKQSAPQAPAGFNDFDDDINF